MYVGLVSAVVVTLNIVGTASSALKYAGWAVAMHLWFLAVYLIVVSLTPIAVAAQRRWGLLVPGVLAAAAAAVDVVSLGSHLPHLGQLNYLLCWGALYQLGIAWRGGLLAGHRPVVLGTGSAVALALLVWLGPYPVSMIGVPGQAVQNSAPPSAAMLAFACAQAGIAIALASELNRRLGQNLVRRALSIGNNNVMALYLWHMMPVVIVAVAAYPAGLLPQPAVGTLQWWLVRLEWVVIVSVVAAIQMLLLWWGRRFFAAPLPELSVPLGDRVAEPILFVGAAIAALGLAFIAAAGFAPDGRFPWATGLVFAFGVVLVALRAAKS